jgi:hypothetical protein
LSAAGKYQARHVCPQILPQEYLLYSVETYLSDTSTISVASERATLAGRLDEIPGLRRLVISKIPAILR